MYNISLRGRVFIALLLLKDHIEKESLDIGWLRKVLDDIFSILLEDSPEIRENLGQLEFDRYDLMESIGERNPYFSWTEVAAFKGKYPTVCKIVDAICTIIKYHSKEDEIYISWSFKTMENLLDLLFDDKHLFIDFKLFDQFIEDSGGKQLGRPLSRAEMQQIKM